MPKTTVKERPLIIVESPTKARTLTRLLGRNYQVLSSQGHVRDLPEKELGVDIENGYEPKFRTIPAKRGAVKKLRGAASKASAVLLATDPDREGEAIAWHLVELIKQAGKAKRVEFREFTRGAVLDALGRPHRINLRRVDAQLGRRVLDRLVGYRISPVLWRKVRRGLSAGRVQSVAVRLICEREEEVLAFKPQEYWTVEGQFSTDGERFIAQLAEVDGVRIVQPGKEPKEGDCRIIRSEAEAAVLRAALLRLDYAVDSVQEKRLRKAPPPPFITATLQQEAFKKLGFQGKRTMRTAQQLYEGVDVGEGPEGLITYMRTDSLRISVDFIQAAREHISREFGERYLPVKPRSYRRRPGAQEAHEAIRPTNLAYTPEGIGRHLSADQSKLYALIYSRFLASQMADAQLQQRQVEVHGEKGGMTARFRSTGSTIVFDGFLRVYREENNEEEARANHAVLALLTAGQVLRLRQLEAARHFTKPPPRYTEASLIKILEEYGIGRPSTYAPIIETIVDRGYVRRESRHLVPSEWAFHVTGLLNDYFPEIVDVAFTARMEKRLDAVEAGRERWQKLVDDFYQPLAKQIEQALADRSRNYRPQPKELDERCPECGRPLVERSGRFGAFVACSGYPSCRFVKRDGERERAAGRGINEACPQCGAPLLARRNRWGWEFVACSAYPQCRFAREPQELCPKCKSAGKASRLVRRTANNRRVFFACERNPGPDAAGRRTGEDACDFILWGRPMVDACELCGWFMAERKQRGELVRFCSNPDCPRHHGSAPEEE